MQESLYPQLRPVIPGLDFAGRCRPARGVGGDDYDFRALGGGTLSVAVGDVSGKGVMAARAREEEWGEERLAAAVREAAAGAASALLDHVFAAADAFAAGAEQYDDMTLVVLRVC